VVLRWEAAYAKRHFIGWSDDGRTFRGYWFTVDKAGSYLYRLGDRQAKYVGILMRERAPKMQNYSFWEAEIYQDFGQAQAEPPNGESVVEINLTENDTGFVEESMVFSEITEHLWLPSVKR